MRALDAQDWAITAEKVERRIIEVGRPLKVILFGSYIRDQTGLNSDVDFLVVTEDAIENPRKESVRIRRALRGICMPMDILVVPESRWLQLKDTPGLIYQEAVNSGKVVYEAALETQLP